MKKTTNKSGTSTLPPKIPSPPYNPSLSIPERAVEILKSHLGKHEEGGENMGPIVEWAMKPWSHVKPDQTGWAEWCAAAACTAYLEAGSQRIQKLASLSVALFYRHLYSAGLVYFPHRSSILPQRGDLVFLGSEKPTHVELLLSYDPFKHEAVTIGGNVDDAVRISNSSQFYGFAKVIEESNA